MKVLFLDPEQYVDFENEPSNYQVRLPFLNAGVITEHRDFVYQRVLRETGKEAMNCAALAEAEAFKPDLIVNSLAWPNEILEPETLIAMRAKGFRVLSVLWDTWINPPPHELEIFLASDIVMIMDSLVSYLRYRGLREQLGTGARAIFSPIGVFTDVVRPIDTPKDVDVLLLGSPEGQRRTLADTLAAKGIHVQALGGLTDGRGGKAPWVDWQSYAATINRAKICLSSQTQPDRLQIKGKIFDYLACGAFCLADANPELTRFVPKTALATYGDANDCARQIARYLADEPARARIAAAGHAWFKATYDYKTFWRDVSAGREPMLPGIAEAYAEFKAKQPLLVRSQLAALSQLAHLTARAPDARRLPVKALGSYRGMNILSIDGRFTVATDGLEIDFLELDGELHAYTSDMGLVAVPVGEPVVGRPTQLLRTGSLESAKRVIDSLR